MNCKLCGAKIQFIRTPAGKYLPCNPRAVTYYLARSVDDIKPYLTRIQTLF
nr:MAG TPA: zinc finger protein [Caudoviricetes sp.]